MWRQKERKQIQKSIQQWGEEQAEANSYLSNLLLFFVSLFAVVAIHEKWIPLSEPLAVLVSEIAFAIMVAVVLIYTIDKSNKARHQRAADALIEKINSNLFHAIYKRLIPAKVFAEVEKCLLRAVVYRTNYELVYTLKKVRNDPQFAGYLLCNLQSSYKLTNLTDSSIRHKVLLVVEVPIDKKMTQYVSIDMVKMDGVELKHEEIQERTVESPDQKRFTCFVDIPAKGSISIKSKSTLVKRELDQEIWHSMLPSEGISLTVLTEGCDLEISATAFHSEQLEKVTDLQALSKWTLDHGIFPHQALSFWWKPKETGVAAVEEGTQHSA